MNKMPPVKKCEVESCYFNNEQRCRAGAITVGSGEPRCETFAQSASHSRVDTQAEVGACHVTSCRYNKSGMACELSRIEVEPQSRCHTGEPCDESLCGSYKSRV